MLEKLKHFHFNLQFDSYIWAVLAVVLLLLFVFLLALTGYYLARYFTLKTVEKLLRNKKYFWLKSIYQHKVLHYLIYLVPLFILYCAGPLFKDVSFSFISMLSKPLQIITECVMVIISLLAFYGFLNSIEDKYNHSKFAKQRPIKSYLQVIKIIVSLIAGLIIASMLLEKSLAYFITGLSAMTAVMLLVFRESILGFVASVQLSAHDMIRIGDWIEVPTFGADGTVLDISLNTVKIENFDKSIVMIPSSAFLTNSVKNWRAMNDAGARRIKRVIYIEVSSIKFIENAHPTKNIKTNLGEFRQALEQYLSSRDDIFSDKTLVVHECEAVVIGRAGLPLEVYAFTSNTDWEDYERTQAEIFEYIYASLPSFGLKAVGSG